MMIHAALASEILSSVEAIMIKHLSKGLLLASVVGLAGCTGSTNPETAHLFDNIRNLQTGEYDRQIAAKDAQAQAIIANNRASEARIGQMQRQASSNSAQISALRSQISSVRAEAATARSRVAGDPAKSAQLNRLEGQITAIQADVNAGGDPAVSRRELNQVSAAIRALTS